MIKEPPATLRVASCPPHDYPRQAALSTQAKTLPRIDLLNRPFGNGSVDLGHQADGFGQGRHNLPVMG